MDIEKYTGCFHDGSIVAISHTANEMTISMESAEVDEEDIKDDIILAKDDRLRGKLHIEGIKRIKENGQTHLGVLKMKYADAELFHFEVKPNQVEFQIKWGSYPPKPCIEDFSTVEIEAEKIYWENIPDLTSLV